jgi:hypothetical protein
MTVLRARHVATGSKYLTLQGGARPAIPILFASGPMRAMRLFVLYRSLARGRPRRPSSGITDRVADKSAPKHGLVAFRFKDELAAVQQMRHRSASAKDPQAY